MYQPKFTYTNRIVGTLTKIAEARAVILSAPLVPKRQAALRQAALLSSTHSSTAIEGNRLSLEEVAALAAGQDIPGAKKDKQEVLNYIEALEIIPELAKKHFDIDLLLRLHKTISQDTLEHPKYEGELRKIQVYVGNSRGQVVFMPPAAKDVPALMDDFLGWLNGREAAELDPVMEAGAAHYELVRIHPFADGNGRTARALATLVLYCRDFDTKRFFTLDEHYDRDRRAYYDALNSADNPERDLTAWLEYFTAGALDSIKAVKLKVFNLSKEIKALKERGQIALDPRQMIIVEDILENGPATNRRVRELFDISNRAALNELGKLLELGVIRQAGKGRNVRYELA